LLSRGKVLEAVKKYSGKYTFYSDSLKIKNSNDFPPTLLLGNLARLTNKSTILLKMTNSGLNFIYYPPSGFTHLDKE